MDASQKYKYIYFFPEVRCPTGPQFKQTATAMPFPFVARQNLWVKLAPDFHMKTEKWHTVKKYECITVLYIISDDIGGSLLPKFKQNVTVSQFSLVDRQNFSDTIFDRFSHFYVFKSYVAVFWVPWCSASNCTTQSIKAKERWHSLQK